MCPCRIDQLKVFLCAGIVTGRVTACQRRKITVSGNRCAGKLLTTSLCGFAATRRWGPNGDSRNMYPNPFAFRAAPSRHRYDYDER